MTAPRAVFAKISAGPYAGSGRYIVHRAGARRLRGVLPNGRPWTRPPYYGHVWREGHLWRASIPGGYHVGTFPTRAGAGAALLRANRPA